MNSNTLLNKTLFHAIANGRLSLNREDYSISFQLKGNDCYVSGRLLLRPDWADALGRPGTMPMIETITLPSGEAIDVDSGAIPSTEIGALYPVLQERLAPERLFTSRKGEGWLLTSSKSKPMGDNFLLCA